MSQITRYDAKTPVSTSSQHDLIALLLGTMQEAVDARVRPRVLAQLKARLADAQIAAERIERMITIIQKVVVASAVCATEVERLGADLTGHLLRRRKDEYHLARLALEREGLAVTVKSEAEIASLRRELERERLTAQLDAFRAATAPKPPQQQTISITPHLDAEQAAARRKQQEAHARWIVEDVQAGHVPTDALTPYHAFAACFFVSAQLEGASVAEAAARTRDVLLDRLTAGQPMLAGDPERHKARYDDLRMRLDALSGNRQTASVLAAMQRLGETAHGNGNGGGLS